MLKAQYVDVGLGSFDHIVGDRRAMEWLMALTYGKIGRE
jgi:hypothetical protein